VKEPNRGTCTPGDLKREIGLTMETFNLFSGETDEGPPEASGYRCRAEYPDDEQVGIWAGEARYVLDRPTT
jgi:hypothetical protein